MFFLDYLRRQICLKHYSICAKDAYVDWVNRKQARSHEEVVEASLLANKVEADSRASRSHEVGKVWIASSSHPGYTVLQLSYPPSEGPT